MLVNGPIQANRYRPIGSLTWNSYVGYLCHDAKVLVREPRGRLWWASVGASVLNDWRINVGQHRRCAAAAIFLEHMVLEPVHEYSFVRERISQCRRWLCIPKSPSR